MIYKVSMRAARVNANLSVREVAEALDVHFQTYGNWERNKFSAPMDKIHEFCELVGVPFENLITPTIR